MRCTACGFDNAAGHKFCGQCGTPLTTGCPSCGTVNPAGTDSAANAARRSASTLLEPSPPRRLAAAREREPLGLGRAVPAG